MINKDMKHFIYKTTHTSGKYYIGRHSTENIDDGYLGSGKWISQVKNKETLTREILEFVNTFDELVYAETKYLTEHFGKPKCMNMSNVSTGWAIGEYNPNKDGRNAKLAYERGTHNSITNNPSTVNANKGTHHWQNGKSPNYEGKLNKKLIEEGRHNFLGPDLNNKRIEEGTHNFLGSASNLKRLAEGRHPSQQKKTCEHCGKTASVGMYKRWHGDKCKTKGQ